MKKDRFTSAQQRLLNSQTVLKVAVLGGALAFLGASCWNGGQMNSNVAEVNTNTTIVNENTVVGSNTNTALNTNENTNSSNQIDTSDWLTYTNEEYGFSFRYPEYFGTIEVLEDKGCLGKAPEGDDPCEHISLFFPDLGSETLFLSSSTPEYVNDPPGRGGYWGDNAKLVVSNDFVKNFCTDKEVSECSVYENKNRVLIAEFDCNEIGCSDNSKIYYIKSPNPYYYGIVVSSDRLVTKKIKQATEIVSAIVDSLLFPSKN